MPRECDCSVGEPEIAGKAASLLTRLSGELELLGEALCGDADFASRHVVILQKIDVVAQQQRAIADLLKCQDLDAALSAAGLEMLERHFRRDL